MGRRARLLVNVSTPDGAVASARGLGAWLSAMAPARARGELTVAVVSDRRMRVLNRTFRGKDAVTDVLSFPATGDAHSGAPAPGVVASLGDIVIAGGLAARQAREHGHPLRTELRLLALHGFLHLLGYDHESESDGGRMARAEARLRRKAGLPVGVIARVSHTAAVPHRRAARAVGRRS